MLIQLLFVLVCIIVGARIGGVGLGVMGGLGVALLTFVFGLEPTSPPIDVMLMIAAVISAAGAMQAAGGIETVSYTVNGCGFVLFQCNGISLFRTCRYGDQHCHGSQQHANCENHGDDLFKIVSHKISP